MNHDELRELVPIFALDALSSGEEAEVAAHLARCAECSDLLSRHYETAGALAFAVEPVPAPAALKDRILAAAAAPAPARSAVRPFAVTPPRRRWSWQLAGLAAACLLAVVVASGGFLRLDEQNERLSRQQETLALVGSPDAEVLAMAPPEGGSGAHGRAFVSRGKRSAAVVMAGLEPAGEGVYTMWTIEGGSPTRVSDFTPEDGIAVVEVDMAVLPGTTLAVTREPNPGNTEPQGPVVLAAAPS